MDGRNMVSNIGPDERPLVVVTGAGGGIGSALARALAADFRVVGLDLDVSGIPGEAIAFDLTSDDSVELAMRKLRERHGRRIAAVVHLAAYFDFTGEPNPLYEAVNRDGTRRLLRALQSFEVEQFALASTMLVHAPCAPGERIDETAPIAPRWAYPQSKAATEEVVRAERGGIPCVILRLAGLYDDRSAVPTLAHQIARVYERNPKSHLYSGDPRTGQSMVHRDDAIEAFRRAVDRRAALPRCVDILVGEPDGVAYQTLQDRLGRLIHGESDWATLTVPKTLAAAGARMEAASEPVVPDALDRGEGPFVRPFMIAMADDHYALDTTRARELLGWRPRHRLLDTLPCIIAALKSDPPGWYEAHGITLPHWLRIAAEHGAEAEALRAQHEKRYRAEHRRNLWAAFFSVALGIWLITAPARFGYESEALASSDLASGLAVTALALLSLSWRFGVARWALAAVGVWVMFAPLAFWAPTAAGYLNGTLCGALVTGLAVLVRPAPGIGPVAAETGSVIPAGWDFSPSSWLQRLPIIALAVVGFFISSTLAAYQLDHIDGVWEPFFAGSPADPKNGTEEIITSWVSRAWPVSDAGVGALTYMLEILTGVIGSARRWRTMPWLVILFGLMIVPLGVVSITFIVVQPILLGTWCTLCLIAAAAMLIQIPYSLDELVAAGQFLRRSRRAGRNLLRVFVVGGTDDAQTSAEDPDDFEQVPSRILGDMLHGGVGLPWNLASCGLIGVWLMFTRLGLGTSGGMADADHLIGALVITVTVTALAEVARPVRYLNIAFGAALWVTPFAFDAAWPATLSSLACGLALVLLSLRRGPIRNRYGTWDAVIV